MKRSIIGVAFVVAIIVALFAFFFSKLLNQSEPIESELTVVEQTESPIKISDNSSESLGELQQLKTILEANLKEQEGDWAIYIENLDTGSKFAINNHKMVSASLIKLFIMGEVYREIFANNIAMNDVDAYLEKMITVSDNESSNILVSKLGNGVYTDMYAQDFKNGLNKVNGFASSIGCKDTEQQRDMKDFRAVSVAEQNYTSVEDCGRLLSMLYHKTLVTAAFDEEMLARLKRQTRRHKIPNGIPSSTICANKTGELSDVENDAAIVYSPACDYIICVMSNDLIDTNSAQQNIIELSSLTYQYFNATDIVSH